MKIMLNKRDDITLRDILKEIQKELFVEFKCEVPAVPHDDLLAEYPNKEKFMEALDGFLRDGDKALRETNHRAASELWRNHLGGRFPLGQDKEERFAAGTTAAAAGAVTSLPYGHG